MTLRLKVFRAVITLIVMLQVSASFAAIDVHKFSSESARQRYMALIEELRCPKCQNQNLSGSDSAISMDLRSEVARLIEEGKTDREIKNFMVDRYGDFVLYNPPIQGNTLVLWWGPAVMLLVGVLIFVVIVVRRRRQIAGDAMTDDERHQLNSWIEGDEGSSQKSSAKTEGAVDQGAELAASEKLQVASDVESTDEINSDDEPSASKTEESKNDQNNT